MHIAICDDNMADRYQLERLLKRESDKRISSTGNWYTDAFGNCDALLSNPMRYDAFYIDVCKTEGITGVDVVNRLSEAGVNAPIILCCSDINYREFPFPANVFFLDKPIKADELADSLDHAVNIKNRAESLIEFREDKETYYVTEPDILYAVESGRYMVVTLTSGQTIHVLTNTANLFAQLAAYPSFIAPNHKTIINGRYISKLGLFKAVMTDGSVFKIHASCMAYTKSIHEKYR